MLAVSILPAFFHTAAAQERSLTFTSVTDAKYYVYLNGTLQNEKSSGMVTINGLEEKEYHVRIVLDDPFVVAVTRKIKPDKKHNEYSVEFNAVKERIYLKPRKAERNEVEWQPEAPAAESAAAEPSQAPHPRASIRRTTFEDTATQRVMNRVRTHMVSE